MPLKPGKDGLGRTADRPYWVLMLSIGIRAAHQVGAAVFLASFLFKRSLVLPEAYLILVCVSGVLLLGTEGLRHRQLLRELAGVSTLVKLVIFGLAFHSLVPATPAMVFAFVLASVCAHAPKSIRHRLLF